ncbi:MAG: HD domain-containing protein [Candidatus Hydrogenedentes bacterium]|nr:HD domain-containing protein [Candidatus Hydrogenedentota bacterium]
MSSGEYIEKTVYVRDLAANMAVKQPFIVINKDLRSSEKGGAYLLVTLGDRTGDIPGIQWTYAAQSARGFEPGDVVVAAGTVSTYQGKLQLRIESITRTEQELVDLRDYVRAVADTDELFGKLRALLDTVQDEHLRRLIGLFLEDEPFMRRFKESPAGKRWHHALVGGLLLHTYEVMSICDHMCKLYPSANRDIVITAAFLHDLGKVYELERGVVRDYTVEGRLLGHIVIGTQMALDRIRRIDGFPEELRLHIEHAVLSHQGELVQESPVVPKTLETCIVYHADNLDAQTNAFLQIKERTEERGEAWSEYIGLIGRQVWTGKLSR